MLTAEDPVCGSLLALNATSEEQILESPGFGSGRYPLGLHCHWTVAGQQWTDRVSLRLIAMDLENSTRSAGRTGEECEMLWF